jgi:hypothetical protein
MPFTFRKSIKILPGVRLNLGRRSRSITIGTKRIKRNYSSNGRVTTSVDLPGPVNWRTSRRRNTNR